MQRASVYSQKKHESRGFVIVPPTNKFPNPRPSRTKPWGLCGTEVLLPFTIATVRNESEDFVCLRSIKSSFCQLRASAC